MTELRRREDTREAVKATKLRIERERAGLPELEQKLLEMHQANRSARRTGDEAPWSDEEFDEVEAAIKSRIAEIQSRL